MFLNNKYTRWYNQLMDSRSKSPLGGYVERHHKIPKCLGGTDEVINLVNLSAREHFIAHALLVRMTEGQQRARLAFALSRMLSSKSGIWSEKKYVPRSAVIFELHRRRAISEITGTNNPNFSKKGPPMSNEAKAKLSASRKKLLESGETQKNISAALKGKSFPRPPMSDAQREKVSLAHKGKKLSEEHKEKLSVALKGKKQNQPKWSEERKRARSEKMLGKPQRSPSAETRAKIGNAHRNKQISVEQRKLISEKLTGRIVSEETKQKMRDARLRYVREKTSRSD
jgi:hypothetical protein